MTIEETIKNFTNVYGKQTWTPNEWFTDNPLIGKVTKGSINGSPVNNGQFWFDNFIGVNNYYLSQYIWFVIMNDDWLIYILFFGEYDKRNNADTSKPIIIKHRKTNTLIYSGCDGHLPVIYKPFNPIKNITYNMNSSLGDDSLREFDVSFQSHDINIKIKSIDVASRIFSVPYYESNDININNLAITAENIKNAINNRTKAIVLVHCLGFNGINEEIIKIAKENNILLIEDCCESHGATFKDKKVGTYGDISVFSFYFYSKFI